MTGWQADDAGKTGFQSHIGFISLGFFFIHACTKSPS